MQLWSLYTVNLMLRFCEKWDKILKTLSLLITFLLDENGRYIVIINTEENTRHVAVIFCCFTADRSNNVIVRFMHQQIYSTFDCFYEITFKERKIRCFPYVTYS